MEISKLPKSLFELKSSIFIGPNKKIINSNSFNDLEKNSNKYSDILLLTTKYQQQNIPISILQVNIAEQLDNVLNTIHQNIISLINEDIYLETLNLEKILLSINPKNVDLKKSRYDINCEYVFTESIERVLSTLKTESKYGFDTIYRAVGILLEEYNCQNLVNIVTLLYDQLPKKIVNTSLEQIKPSSEHIIKIIVFNELSKIITSFTPNINKNIVLNVYPETSSSETTQYIEEENKYKSFPVPNSNVSNSSVSVVSTSWQREGSMFQIVSSSSVSRDKNRD